MSKEKDKQVAQVASHALERNVARFDTLYPNGKASLREDRTTTFGHLNSAEMVAEKQSS